MILSRELGKRIWGGSSTNIENGGGGVSSDYIAGLLTGYATESWVDEHYISIDFFSRLFQAHGTENGSEIDVLPNDMETTITSVESMFGFWTNLYISALGSNGAAPAGISLGMLTDVNISGTPSAGQILTFDAVTQKWVNGNAQAGATALANLTDVTLTSVANGQTLLYDSTTSKWYNSALKTINGQSLLGSGDISVGGGASGNYLPLTGGTLTNPDFRGQLTIMRSNGNDPAIAFQNTNGLQGCMGFSGGTAVIWYGSSYTSHTIATLTTLQGYLPTTGGTMNGSILFTYGQGIKLSYITNPSTVDDYYRCIPFGNSDDVSSISYTQSTLLYNPRTERLQAGGLTLKSGHLYLDGQDPGSSLAGSTQLVFGNNGSVHVVITSNDHMVVINPSLTSTAGQITLVTNGTSQFTSIYATGAITALSDARKKDITGEAGVTVEQIAHAPAVQFLWKDEERRKDGQQVGTLAQYWQTVLPEVVSDKGGELSMQYGVAALVSAIVTARKVVDHERRITELEKEVKQLRLN